MAMQKFLQTDCRNTQHSCHQVEWLEYNSQLLLDTAHFSSVHYLKMTNKHAVLRISSVVNCDKSTDETKRFES